MRYLVTGAAGFIGSHLADRLRVDGHEVVGVDSFTDYYDPVRKRENAEGVDVVETDLVDADLEGLLEGVDGVFHLAGQPGVRSFGDVFPLYVERNVLASQRVFEAAADVGTRVVFASSSSIYGEAEQYPTPEETPPRPLSPYGITKLACEHLARASGKSLGLDAVVLRYFNAYGPRQRPDMAFPRVVDALLEERPFTLFGDGEQSRSFTYVGDVVAASIVAMERAPTGSVYNVGGGQEATMNETIAMLERLTGRRLDVRRAEAVAGDQRRTKADTTRIRDELGWQPSTTLEGGLRAQWRWAVESPA
jgi:UDP-glucuronate 4-epimerase